MDNLKKKQKIAYWLTIVTLANIWASLIFQPKDIVIKGVTAMATVMLIGVTIERWARFIEAYIDNKMGK